MSQPKKVVAVSIKKRDLQCLRLDDGSFRICNAPPKDEAYQVGDFIEDYSLRPEHPHRLSSNHSYHFRKVFPNNCSNP